MTLFQMKKISYLFLVITVLGCSPIEKDFFVSFDKTYELKHYVHDELIMKDPHLAVSDSFLIIVSAYNDKESKVCNVYSIYDKVKKIGSYGEIGSGPKEFRQPVLTFAKHNKFGLNDINEKTLTILEIIHHKDSTNIIEHKRLKAPLIKQRKEYIPLDTRYMPINDGSFYISSIFMSKNKCFTLSDSTLIPVQRFGRASINEDIDGRIIRNRLNGYIATYGDRMFFATMNLPYISSYKLGNGEMQECWEKFYATPYYTVSNGDVKYDKEKSIGPLKAMCVDSKYIYLLYMEQLLSEYNVYDTEKSASSTIYVFDYSGMPIARLNLDCKLIEIAINTKQNKLYGIAQLPDYSLVEFNLPKDL